MLEETKSCYGLSKCRNDDAIDEAREYIAELEEQMEDMQRDWASPVEVAGLKRNNAELLSALVSMVDQYLRENTNPVTYYHWCMSAGEETLDLLAHMGVMRETKPNTYEFISKPEDYYVG